MTYAELKRKVLELIGRYSIAGAPIAPDYNNQSDYEGRIPGLLNDAALRIRTEARPRVSILTFSNGGTQRGGMRMFALPEGYRGIKTGGVRRISGGRVNPVSQYRLLGERSILLPDDGADYSIEYYCAPERLPSDLSDEYETDDDPEVLTAACYYAASMLLIGQDEFAQATLYNEFQSRLEGMRRPPTAEISDIEDAYGFSEGGC